MDPTILRCTVFVDTHASKCTSLTTNFLHRLARNRYSRSLHEDAFQNSPDVLPVMHEARRAVKHHTLNPKPLNP